MILRLILLSQEIILKLYPIRATYQQFHNHEVLKIEKFTLYLFLDILICLWKLDNLIRNLDEETNVSLVRSVWTAVSKCMCSRKLD